MQWHPTNAVASNQCSGIQSCKFNDCFDGFSILT